MTLGEQRKRPDLKEIVDIVNEQAEDDGLWFMA